MRTNVVIDDDLMVSALKVTGYKTKKAVIEERLKLLIQTKQQAQMKKTARKTLLVRQFR